MTDTNGITRIQATISGFEGKPCSLFSLYDQRSKVLVVAKVADYRIEREGNSAIITNVSDIERDALFSEKENLFDSILAFNKLMRGRSMDGSTERIVFNSRANQANPSGVISTDGIDVNGTKYRVSPEITCAQVACLATAYFVMKLDPVERGMTMINHLNDAIYRLMAGECVTF